MSKEEIIISGAENYQLSVTVYEAKNAKANIIFIHGMEEHQGRYEPFATFLKDNGYNVVTSDLRGHGKNAPFLSHIAKRKGDKLLIEDQREITKYVKGRFPNLPTYLFAHSMGTIITRVLLQTNSKEYDKVALSGYVNPNPASPIAVCLGNITRVFKGGKGHSKLLTILALGNFVKSVKNRKTVLDWLSFNENNVKNYIEDPLCGVEFTVGSYCALFHLLNNMAKKRKYKNVHNNMPILLAAGKDDPCTGFEKGRTASKKLLDKVGFKDVSVITYENMRHEILNETERDKVYQDILDFFNK